MSDFESERGAGTDWFAAASEDLALTTDAAIEAVHCAIRASDPR